MKHAILTPVMRRCMSCLVTLQLLATAAFAQTEPLRAPGRYVVYPDRVEQKPYRAKALSSDEITSDYQSEANLFIRPVVQFKFSINGKDNEMPVGVNHEVKCISADCSTPLIEFGKKYIDDQTVPEGTYLKAGTQLKIRLDMRHVFNDFNSKGFFQNYSGQKIFKEDFKAVYIAGNLPPLTWDFDNLHNYEHLRLKDDDGDHVFEIILALNRQEDKKVTNPSWKLSLDISSFPQYKSPYVLHDALYNLSLEEMIRAVEKDSTLRTGKEWAGVWTRDVSYSIILSMSILQPKVAQYSLMRKVKNGMVIQDTGTGGAYPISTDRMIWAVAAYEIYKVTGDKEWLRTIYPIIKKSLEADLQNAIDPLTGLVKGESSFLDWREQTYPAWMEPADIYESLCLGTNAVHFQAHTVLATMATEMNDAAVASKHSAVAAAIKKGINTYLWIPEKKYYGQFLYGRNFKMISPKSEALGEALCILFGIADEERQKELVRNTPVNEFGIPCIYPQIPNIPPYHNNSVWPFVQSYWTLACARAGNERAVMESLSAILRPTALFLTNKENFVAANGDFAGTEINSDNMLWSLSGNIAMVYKLLFGMQYGKEEVTFSPFVPEKLKGKRSLTGFRYRDAILDIDVEGSGNSIKSFELDGKRMKRPSVSGTLKGRHRVRIVLQNNGSPGEFALLKAATSPETPVVTLEGKTLRWNAVDGATAYRVYRNAKTVSSTGQTSFEIKDNSLAEYQVVAVSSSGIESFASEPVIYTPPATMTIVEIERSLPKATHPYKGYSGEGFVETSLQNNATFSFDVDIPEEGVYALDFRYSNGNGPVNTENKCGLRGLIVNGVVAGTVVFPQRGVSEWSEWGFTNSTRVKLVKGINKITVFYQEPQHLNMNADVNAAMVDYARFLRIN
jgi:hypothetical protein